MIDEEKASKLVFGTYVKTELGTSVIVGREYVLMHLYPVDDKGIDTTKQQHLEVYPQSLDKIEIIKESNEKEKDLLYTKLMIAQPECKENIRMFRPLERFDLEHVDYVKYMLEIGRVMREMGV